MTSSGKPATGDGARTTRGAAVLAVAWTLLVVGCATVDHAPEIPVRAAGPPLHAPGMPFLGTHLHGPAHPIDELPSAVGSIRLWDAGVAWRDVQPSPRRWNFATLDRLVDRAEGRGLRVLYPLGLTPAWASARPAERSAYDPGNAAPPAEPAHWNAFVSRVASRYKGRIEAYEIWNEPNRPLFFSGDVDAMVALTCEAFRIIKSIDAEAIVVGPAPTDQERGVDWLRQFFAAGGGQCIDAIGFHLYTPFDRPPEAVVELIASIRRAQADSGLEALPLWNTEYGWNIDNATAADAPKWRVLAPDEAYAHLLRSLILQAAANVARSYQYSWNHGWMGLVEPGSAVHKPAASAFTDFATLTAGRPALHCDRVSDVMLCLAGDARSAAVIAWSGKEQAIDIPLVVDTAGRLIGAPATVIDRERFPACIGPRPVKVGNVAPGPSNRP